MVRFERFTDDVLTSLNGAINDSVTSVTVNSATNYPTEGDFRIQINSEVMLVTARSGNVLTVERGADSTTAASHSDADGVRMVMSSDSIKTTINDIFAGGAEHPPHTILDGDGDPLVASGFTWTNQGGATLEDTTYGGLRLNVPANANSANWRLATITAPSTPWKLTAHLTYGHGWNRASWDIGGLVVRDSGTGELIVFRLACGGGQALQWYDNVTTFNSNRGPTSNICWTPDIWLQIENDGVDLFWRFGANGTDWYQFRTEGVTDHLSTLDQVGIFGNGSSGGGFPLIVTAFNFG